MFGRTLKLSIAKDNGRSTEFNSKRIYDDKQRCYECGQDGHLSYKCPVNVLGNRDIPPKKYNSSSNKNRQTVTELQAMASDFQDSRCKEDVRKHLHKFSFILKIQSWKSLPLALNQILFEFFLGGDRL